MKTLLLTLFVLLNSGCNTEPEALPPADASKSAYAILTYFAESWKCSDYDAMYTALSEERREKFTRKEWRAAWREETKVRGVLVDFKIHGPDADEGNTSLWRMDVTYRNKRIGTLTKTTWAVEAESGWRVGNGGLSPGGW
jgi:hypothetical protein